MISLFKRHSAPPKSEKKEPTVGADVQELVSLARDRTGASRNLLLERINAIYLGSGRHLSARERELVFDIFSYLIRHVEVQVRKAISAALSEQGDVPKNLVLTLANDVIDVAEPVVVRSRLLDDGDLIQLILDQAEQHRLAVTQRDDISEDVSQALVDHSGSDVIKSLLRNEGAKLSGETVEKLVDRSMDEEEYQQLLVKRHELTTDMARRMYTWVSDAMRDVIESRYEEIGAELDESVNQAVAEALKSDVFQDPDDTYEPPTGGSGLKGYRPHPKTLVKALKEGDIFLFEELFRDLTDLSEASVTRVLYDSGPEALAIACKACDVDEYVFGQIISYMHGGGDIEQYQTSPQFLKSVDYFKRIDAAGARRVLQAWRDTPKENW